MNTTNCEKEENGNIIDLVDLVELYISVASKIFFVHSKYFRRSLNLGR